jgi:hypothetical protein
MPTSGALIAWAKEHGVSVRGLGLDAVPPADDIEKEMQRLNQVRGLYDEAELQRRYIEFYRNRRDSRLWWIALISAISSVISAATALYAVLHRL